MSTNLRLFTRAIYAFDAVVQRVADDRWSSPSPCEGWDAEDVVRHQCAVLQGVIDSVRSGAPQRPRDPDASAERGPSELWDSVRDELLDALDHLGVLHQRGPFWFDTATIDDLVAMVAWDPATHAWDLATAAGADHGLADGLLLELLPTVEARQPLLVESGRIAPVRAVGEDATVLDRYLAAVGR